MLTKLTLTIDQAIVEKAKKYAHKKRKSVSRIVEEYLKNVSDKNRNMELDESINAPITNSLVGMFKDDGKDYKEMLAQARAEELV